jgi:hypothetical protein
MEEFIVVRLEQNSNNLDSLKQSPPTGYSRIRHFHHRRFALRQKRSLIENISGPCGAPLRKPYKGAPCGKKLIAKMIKEYAGKCKRKK